MLNTLAILKKTAEKWWKGWEELLILLEPLGQATPLGWELLDFFSVVI